MGMNLSVNLKFYFELDPALASEHKVTRYRCSSQSCMNHHRKEYHSPGNFCSNCGSPWESFEFSDGQKLPSPYEFCEQYMNGDEIVCSGNSDSGIPDTVWLYNYRCDTLKKNFGDFDVECGGVWDLSRLNAPSLIEEFLANEEPAQRLLNAVNEVYGPGYITPRFGLFSEWG